MKKIMILGASILQLPAIVKAKEMELEVIAVDMDKNAVGFKYADISLNISTLDIPLIIEAAKSYKIDGIMTLASDMPMRTVAAVSKELKIMGINEETALNATNKSAMRLCLKEHGVPIPKFYTVKDKTEYLSVVKEFDEQCIVKPADNSGSRGIFKIDDVTDLGLITLAYEHSKMYSRSGEIIVEEYMSGSEVSVETLSVDGKVNVIAITDKMTTGAPYFVEIGHSQPSSHSLEIKKKIEEIAVMAVNAVGIKNGPSHTEIMITKEGPKIVEIGARLGGDNITTHLVPLSTGVNMVESCIRIALGEEPDLTQKFSKGSAIKYFETSKGKITGIKGMKKAVSIPGIKQISLVKRVGDYVEDISSSSDRVGFVIAQASTAGRAKKLCDEAKKNIQIFME